MPKVQAPSKAEGGEPVFPRTSPTLQTEPSVTLQEATSLGVIVLGMHRSGTSLASGLFGRMGFSFGGRVLEAEPANPKGYFEHVDTNLVHERFLSSVGAHWRDPRPFPPDLFEGEVAALARREVKSLFQRDFLPQNAWVLKDPRHCRLLPLWRDVFADARVRVSFLHVLRDPFEVAASLAARDTMPLADAVILWLRHNLESELATRGKRRVFVPFHRLIEHAEAALREVVERLGLSQIIAALEPREGEAPLADPELVHHRVSDEKPRERLRGWPWLADAWRGFEALVAGDEAEGQRILDEVRTDLARFDRVLGEPLSRFLSSRAAVYRQIAERTQPQVYELNLALEKAHRELDQLCAVPGAFDRLDKQSEELRRHCDVAERLLGKSLDFVAALEADLDNLRRDLARSSAEQAELKRRLQLHEQEKSAQDQEISRLHQDVGERDRRLREQHDHFVQSWSWWVTTPLRSFKKLVSR